MKITALILPWLWITVLPAATSGEQKEWFDTKKTPWICQVLENGRFNGSAVLLNQNHILCTAHQFVKPSMSVESAQARINKTKFLKAVTIRCGDADRKAKSVTIHHNYKPPDESLPENDLTIVALKKPFSAEIRYPKLPKSPEQIPMLFANGSSCWSAGFGRNYHHFTDTPVFGISLPLFKFHDMTRELEAAEPETKSPKIKFGSDHIAQRPGKIVYGDSGSPIFCYESDNLENAIVIGIASAQATLQPGNQYIYHEIDIAEKDRVDIVQSLGPNLNWIKSQISSGIPARRTIESAPLPSASFLLHNAYIFRLNRTFDGTTD